LPAERVLTRRALNRALLARQHLLDRASVPLPRLLERIGGIQAQYAPSMYVGLFARLDGFERDALTRALERRSVVQATLMRVTIHLVARGDFWPLAVATAAARRETWLGYRRGDLFARAEDWLGPPDTGFDDAVELLVRRYLRGFGPGSRAEIANWAGLHPRVIDPVLERLTLRRFRTESGEALVDLPRLPLPDPETPAPVRLLPTWDSTLLVHARRTGILPEEHRPKIFHVRNPQSTPAFLVDGEVAGTWREDGGKIAFEPFGRLDAATRRALREEGERLVAAVYAA
jgi:hypothetical protein